MPNVKKRKMQKRKKARKPKLRKRGKISLETVRHVAATARLALSEAELRDLQRDLNAILHAFRDLDKIKPKCEPSFQPLLIKDILRKDVIESYLGQIKGLANTKHKERGFFKGPKVV